MRWFVCLPESDAVKSGDGMDMSGAYIWNVEEVRIEPVHSH